MKKIAIVLDSSVSFTQDQIEDYDVYIAPLTITHNNVSYIDQVTITKEEVNNLLREHQLLTTSQPSIGTMIEIFEDIKEKDYDYTFVLSIGTALSGSFNAFNHAAAEAGLSNFEVINTYSITGPVQQGVKAIRSMQDHESIENISNTLHSIFDNQVSYIYPKTLDQVVLSGRMSKTASRIANMLRVKPVLHLENKAESIEVLTIARTDRRAFKALVDDFIKHKVDPFTHDLYLLESEGMETLEKFKDYVSDKMGEFETYIINLPAAVATHAGLGTIAIQWCPKLKKKED
ncbi:DegV family protein [Erysipelothrix urinaevulpis]|uniref:DegV family protein n=1 Tax=Erysipelothrix urinaevulpis TaxID=2683717 RepID=UPI001357F0CA|nr:DegV family protein [Erysipelothrix urinaevulpis]